MRKDAATKLVTLLMALLLVVTLLPAGNVTAQAASKKPGAVTKVTKSEVNPTTVTIAYNKAKNAKGYQIRAYKGKKLVKSAKTKDTSYTVKGLSAETKYTIKVRAYNGSKYGKEKSITVKTETKNLAVTGLRASNVTKDSVKITYKKAKNAKGYQIRVYKGSKQVANVKTKNTSYTVNNLSGDTKYTIKVRAYKGNKYGKEKSIAVRTSKEEPDSGDQAEDDTSRIVMPGESTSTGDALVAEYNAYIAYAAEIWRNYPIPNPTGDEFHDTPWTVPLCHMGAGIRYDANYTDKYSLFKYKAGTPDAEIDMTLDILHTIGVPAEKHDVARDFDRFGDYKPSVDPVRAKGLVVTFPSGTKYVVYITDEYNGTHTYNLTSFEKRGEFYLFIATCPNCGKENYYAHSAEMTKRLLEMGMVGIRCDCGTRKSDWETWKIPSEYLTCEFSKLPHRIMVTELAYTFTGCCPLCLERIEIGPLNMSEAKAYLEKGEINLECSTHGTIRFKAFKSDIIDTNTVMSECTVDDLPGMSGNITLYVVED